MTKTTFDATARATELLPGTFTVADKTFKVKRSGKALKAIVGMAPDDESADDPARNIDLLYDGIALVLIDPETNEHPSAEWLADELDFEVASEFMGLIMPRRAEGNEDQPTPSNVPSTNGTTDQP